MSHDNLQVGDKVYYTGDVANLDGYGEIVARNEDPRWGLSYDIMIDDSTNVRIARGIGPGSFGGAGCRFKVMDDQLTARKLRRDAMIAANS